MHMAFWSLYDLTGLYKRTQDTVLWRSTESSDFGLDNSRRIDLTTEQYQNESKRHHLISNQHFSIVFVEPYPVVPASTRHRVATTCRLTIFSMTTSITQSNHPTK